MTGARASGAGTLVVFGGLLAACVYHSRIEIGKWSPQPISVVSLEMKADDVLPGEDPVEPEALEHLKLALATALIRHGVTVVEKGERGAPALKGDVERYYEGADSEGYGSSATRGEYRIAWRVVDHDGVILGRCVSDADSGLGAGRVDYSALVDSTGAQLASFLLKRKA